MKKIYAAFVPIFLVISSLSFTSCDKDEDQPEPTYQEKQIAFSKAYRGKIRGEWKVAKMVINKEYLFTSQAQDSVITDLGTLFVNNLSTSPINPDLYNQMELYLTIDTETIPLETEILFLLPENTSEQAAVAGLVESGYYFPIPIRTDELPLEYQFLTRYQFWDNYKMVLSPDEKTWTWNGLNRGVKEIVFVR